MRTCLAAVAGFIALGMSTGALAAGKPAGISWGKPGVALAAYHADSQACAAETFGVAPHMQPATVEALAGINGALLYGLYNDVSFFSHGSVNQQGYHAAYASVLPDHVVYRSTTYTSLFTNAAREDIIAQLQAVEDKCLAARGYQRFRLTSGQRHRLDGLKRGSAARELFLHQLGADPAVLASQSI